MVGAVCQTVQLSYGVHWNYFTFCEVTWRQLKINLKAVLLCKIVKNINGKCVLWLYV